VDLLGFLVAQGFTRVVVVNGHGGNAPTLNAAAAEVSYGHEGAHIIIHNWYDAEAVEKLIKEAFGAKEGSHATPAETSLLMYLRPELVGDVSQVALTEPGLVPWHPGPKDLRDHYPQGAVGSDPKLASAEVGEELFTLGVEGIIEVVGKL